MRRTMKSLVEESQMGDKIWSRANYDLDLYLMYHFVFKVCQSDTPPPECSSSSRTKIMYMIELFYFAMMGSTMKT